jgi:hypothetical protein
VGTLPDGTKRTITATVGFPTTAKYVFFTDQATGGWGLGAGATVYGPVHTNGNLYNSGTITGRAEASKICYSGSNTSAPRPKAPSTSYPGGWVDNVKSINFAEFTKGVGDLKSQAIKSGTYLANSSVPGTTTIGYEVHITGTSVVVSHVLRQNMILPNTSAPYHYTLPLGALSVQTLGTYAIPASGVMYFDDDVYVSGDYSANLTIGASGAIYINGNIAPSTSQSNATCGLVSSSDIWLQYWADSVPTQHVIKAALLSIKAAGQISSHMASLQKPNTYSTTTKKWSLTTYTAPTTAKSLFL